MKRGGVLLGAAAATAFFAVGAFVVVAGSDASAQTKKKEAPLDIKGDASARPWKRYAGWPSRDESKWNTLARVSSPPTPKAPRKPSAPVTGDAANGAKLVADRNRGGSCLACHVMGQAGNAGLAGNAGPDLSENGNSGREEEYLCNYIFDSWVFKPETRMTTLDWDSL